MCLLQWLRRCHAACFRSWVPPAEAIQLWLLSRGLKQLVTEIYQDCNLHRHCFGQSVCYLQITPVINTFQVLHILDLILWAFSSLQSAYKMDSQHHGDRFILW